MFDKYGAGFTRLRLTGLMTVVKLFIHRFFAREPSVNQLLSLMADNNDSDRTA